MQLEGNIAMKFLLKPGDFESLIFKSKKDNKKSSQLQPDLNASVNNAKPSQSDRKSISSFKST